MYVIFPCLGNEILADALLAQAKRRGCKGNPPRDYVVAGGMTFHPDVSRIGFDGEASVRRVIAAGHTDNARIAEAADYRYFFAAVREPIRVQLNDEHTAQRRQAAKESKDA